MLHLNYQQNKIRVIFPIHLTCYCTKNIRWRTSRDSFILWLTHFVNKGKGNCITKRSRK